MAKNDFMDYLNNYFDAYKHTSEYRDRSMVEIMSKRKEFEEHLDKMWSIYLKGVTEQIVEYNKQVRGIKESGLKVLRNSAGKHKIVYK
jgi:hypothetical protein